MTTRFIICACTLLIPSLPRAAAEPDPKTDVVRRAVEKSLPLLQKGAVGHREQRTCFACHNQAAPILALTVARSRGFNVEQEELDRQLKFIAAFLDRSRANYLKGKGQGGQIATAGYALWTLELGGWKADETTAAVAEYLLQFDSKLDYWRMTSNRPPSESSQITANYLALRGLQAFGTPEQKERIVERVEKVRGWLVSTRALDTEDRVFRLGALARAGLSLQEMEAAARELIKTQQENGGWAQLEKMSPDAYATGTALYALREFAGLPADDPVYRRGVDFLLATQKDDGSWHVASRSKPFQTYFETGFPHGKDQFISSAASSWATAALALALPATKK